jgi:hypothetical protein
MKSILVLMASLMTLSLAAVAGGEGHNDFNTCKADMERLCGSVKPGEGRQVKCLMQNKSQASSGCQAVLAKKEQKEKEWQQGKPNKVKHPQ